MRLITLGGLRLEGSSYRGKVPLLLLAYLALTGPSERRFVANLFWPQASDPLNSLSAALTRLRKHAPGFVDTDEVRVWTTIQCDASDFLEAVKSAELEASLSLYERPFLDGFYWSDMGSEFEEWLLQTREGLAGRVRQVMLRLAEANAAQGQFEGATTRAEAVHRLEGTPAYDPEDLSRLYTLLQAGNSPLSSVIQQEAADDYDLKLELTTDEARGRLQRFLLGRDKEREQLLGLEEGEWALVRGGPGMGKTTLLKSLLGKLLPGRSGLPYATLETLIQPVLHEGESSILQHLRTLEGLWLIDNWERVDEESKELLRRLQAAGFQARAVISARDSTSFTPNCNLKLGPLSPEALAAHPGAWEKTKGLPAFVDAFLRDQPLYGALEERLATLSEGAREVYLALGLLDAPDLALVRQALGLSAEKMAQATETLLEAGLIEPDGQVKVRQATLEYLDLHPTYLGPLALKLARQLDDLAAFPLYQTARSLWTSADESKALSAYQTWVRELLKRGFPQKALDVLAEIPATCDVGLLKGRVLEKAGRFEEAFHCIKDLVEPVDVLSLKASLLERLGRHAEAKKAAEQALQGSTEARAEAQMVLGRLALARADYQEASKLFRRAAALWKALNRLNNLTEALNNEAVARLDAGEDAKDAFETMLTEAGGNLALRSLALLNLGREYERREAFAEAIEVYLEAIPLAERVGSADVASCAWNNLGVCYEQSKPEEARQAYEQAIIWARQSGDQQMIAMALANLATLEDDFEAWQEALHLLEAAGHEKLVVTFWDQLPSRHSFRQLSGGEH